jgi:hypothetical protein
VSLSIKSSEIARNHKIYKNNTGNVEFYIKSSESAKLKILYGNGSIANNIIRVVVICRIKSVHIDENAGGHDHMRVKHMHERLVGKSTRDGTSTKDSFLILLISNSCT